MDAIQAAILRIKLRRLDEWNARRQEIAAHYNQLLAGTDIITPEIPSGGRHVFYCYAIRVPGGRRDALRAFLTERGVGTQIHYPVPIHMQEAAQFLGYRQGDLPVTERVANEVLSLPCYAELTDAMIDRVASEVRAFMKK